VESKHPFEEWLDTEQVFVVRWRHDEHGFDAEWPGGSRGGRPRGGSVTATWLAPTPGPAVRPGGRVGPRLRLLSPDEGARPVSPAPIEPRGAHRVPLEVRRRRTLLAVMGILVVALALPLGGIGGHSHAAGSAPAGTSGRLTYTVRPGDTLWSIAERLDPAADPRPLVARLTAQDGSDQVVPGQRIVVP
jgi:LysM domain